MRRGNGNGATKSRRLEPIAIIGMRGRFPGGLHHQADGADFRLRPLDGQRDALAALVQAHDDKLSRTVLARDPRRLDDEPLNSWRDRFCLHDWEQVAPSTQPVSCLTGRRRGSDVHHDRGGRPAHARRSDDPRQKKRSVGRSAAKPCYVRTYTKPWSSMELATLRKPAMLAPLTRFPGVP